jgi:hypothetical protein
MPSQVSWQLVVTKSAASVHGRGVIAEADGALVGVTSAAHASDALEAPTTATSNAAQIPSFGIKKLPATGPTARDQTWLAGGSCCKQHSTNCAVLNRKSPFP